MYPLNRQQNAVWMIVIATVALSAKGILAKFVYAADTGVDVLLLVRFGVAAPIFWLWLWLKNRKQTVAGEKSQRSVVSQLGSLLIAAGCFFVATYADFSALSVIDAGLSRLILFTFPVFVLLINLVISRRLPGWRLILALSIAYAGLLLVMGDALTSLPSVRQAQWLQGIGWAFLAAVAYAVYLVYSQRVLRDISSAKFSAISGSFIFLMLAGLQIARPDSVLNFTLEGLFWSSLIAVFCTVVPFLLMHEAIRQASAEQVSRISLSGPGMTLLLAWWLLGEEFGLVQLAGMLMTVAAVAWLERPVDAPNTVTRKPRADLKVRSG